MTRFGCVLLKFSGYMSPEYAMEGRFSEKSDVFSFGVLLLEIVSGRKNSSFYHDEQSMSLLGHVSHPYLIPLLFTTSNACFFAKNFNPLFIFPGVEIVESKQHCGLNRPTDI